MAIDLAEFGQLGNQGAGDDIVDAGYALQQILLGAPDGAGVDQLVERVAEARPLGFQALEQSLEGALRNAVPSFAETLLFGVH